MVDYGLNVKNSNQEVQIDSQYRNLSLDSSGSGVSIDNSTGGTFQAAEISIDSSALVPLIVWQPSTSYFSIIFAYNKSGDNYISFYATTEDAQTDSINWKCYRENRAASGDTYGLLVYNSGGNLVFDSGKKYLKIRQISSASLSNPSAWSYPSSDVSHTSYSDPYYVLSPNCGFWYLSAQINPSQWRFQYLKIGLKKLNSTSVRVGWFPTVNVITGANIGNVSEGFNPSGLKLIICEE